MTDVAAAEPNAIQWIIDFMGAAVLAIGGGVMKSVRTDIREQAAKHDQLAASLPDTYARRDDVKDGFAQLQRQHELILHKLDQIKERS